MIKIGDLVYFCTSGFDFKSGIIIGKEGCNYLILSNGMFAGTYMSNEVYGIEDKDVVVKLIQYDLNNKLNKLSDSLKSVERSFYQDGLKEKYADIRTQIINTALHMNKDLDDTDFENKLKAICRKKNDLFSIECEGSNKARKHNGEVKYKMSKIRQDIQYVIDRLDDGLDWYNRQVDNLKSE